MSLIQLFAGSIAKRFIGPGQDIQEKVTQVMSPLPTPAAFVRQVISERPQQNRAVWGVRGTAQQVPSSTRTTQKVRILGAVPGFTFLRWVR